MHGEKPPHTKSFTFADGSSTDDKVIVWRIPLFLGGHRGEVFSAEIPTGSTPLLLSIPAMEALDMKEEGSLQSLGISLPLLTTRTRHLAIDLLNAEGRPPVEPLPGTMPVCQSVKDDLVVFD